MKKKAYETPDVKRRVVVMETVVMAGSLTDNELNTNNVTVSPYENAQDGFNDPDAGFNSIGF